MELKSESFLRRVASVRGAAVLREDLISALRLLDEERRLVAELGYKLVQTEQKLEALRDQAWKENA